MHAKTSMARGWIVPPSALLAAALVGLILASARCAGTLEDPARFADGGGGGGGAAANDASSGTGAASNDASSGTGAASDDAGGSPQAGDATTCPDVPQSVFLPNCTSAGCHNAQDKEQGLDLASPNVATRLVNVPSTEGQGLLIDPSTPSAKCPVPEADLDPPLRRPDADQRTARRRHGGMRSRLDRCAGSRRRRRRSGGRRGLGRFDEGWRSGRWWMSDTAAGQSSPRMRRNDGSPSARGEEVVDESPTNAGARSRAQLLVPSCRPGVGAGIRRVRRPLR